jgi:hypothetical protein
MIRDNQALDRIRDAVGHYLQRTITYGEAIEDVVTALEASGRDAAGVLPVRRAGEARSWSSRRGELRGFRREDWSRA